MTEKFEINHRRKVTQLSAVFFVAILAFVSCKKDPTNLGDSLQDASLGEVFTDTLSIITYSEITDSLETDETSVNLLGSYIDPVFGKVDCGIVTQMRLSSASPEFGEIGTLVMDSVVLSLRYTSIKYYGNLDPVTVEVYEIGDALSRDDNYYNFTSPTIVGGNLVEPGYEVVTPDVVSDKIVGNDTMPAHFRVRLDPSFGMDMVNADAAGYMATQDAFVSFFKGLYIKVNGSALSTGQGTVLYFVLENSLSNVTMYFHDSGDNIAKEYTFEFNSEGARYNDIKFDRSGTFVEEVLADSTKGAEQFFLQGSSMRAIVYIPYLMNLNKDSLGNSDPKIINKAELVLPIQDFTTDAFDPSTQLFIAKMIDGSTSTTTLDYPATQSGLQTVSYDEDTKSFRFLITREIQAMLNGERDYTGFRIYSPSYFGSTIERIVFNGSGTSLKDKPRIEITYTTY